MTRRANSESGGTSSALQSVVDLEATFLGVAGLTPSTGSQGVCQTGSWKDAAVKSRDWALVEFRPSQGDFMQWTFIMDIFVGHAAGLSINGLAASFYEMSVSLAEHF
jgi:hypothetical protein